MISCLRYVLFSITYSLGPKTFGMSWSAIGLRTHWHLWSLYFIICCIQKRQDIFNVFKNRHFILFYFWKHQLLAQERRVQKLFSKDISISTLICVNSLPHISFPVLVLGADRLIWASEPPPQRCPRGTPLAVPSPFQTALLATTAALEPREEAWGAPPPPPPPPPPRKQPAPMLPGFLEQKGLKVRVPPARACPCSPVITGM